MVYDLKSFEKFIPNKKTYAVFGNPISHSLSPALHTQLATESGMDFDYIAIETSNEDFPYALELAKEKLCGFNLTMPFKQLVLPYVEVMHENVLRSGSANTIKVVNGKLHAFTTDGIGLCAALRLSVKSLAGERVLILGAGGTARSVAAQIAIEGAHVTVAVRSAEKGEVFVRELSEKTGLTAFSYVMFNKIPDSFDILINTTPVGMNNENLAPVNLSDFTGLKLVYDCIYSPPMTPLLRDAEKLGIPWDNGLSMLVLQGAYSERHWFDASFDNEIIKKTIHNLRVQHAISRLKSVYNKSNIALTGFMGSGKTTIGKLLAEALNMDFIDLDAKIENEQKLKITEIFDKYGEDHFRALETKACEDCIKLENTVISTGGGTVIHYENDKILKNSSVILFLNRTFEQIEKNLQGSTSRPLLQVNNVREHIRSLYDLRQPQYIDKADISVTFQNNDVSDAAEHILYFI